MKALLAAAVLVGACTTWAFARQNVVGNASGSDDSQPGVDLKNGSRQGFSAPPPEKSPFQPIAAPSKPVTPENDSQLAKVPQAQSQKIGILTYYPNKGGGYTFFEGKELVFYALPYMPQPKAASVVLETVNGKVTRRIDDGCVLTIGTSKMPSGSQFIYCGRMIEIDPGSFTEETRTVREDVPIAKWWRDKPDGSFRFKIIAEDRDTYLKINSIRPVLEHALKPQLSNP